MRSRTFLIALSGVFIIAAPFAAHATSIPYFGPIVGSDASTCAAGWGAVLETINNIIAFAITIAITFVAPIMIAYAGFLFVVNPVNASGKEQAKLILLNTIVGIVISLAGYLIVDTVLTALTYQGVAGWTAQVFQSNGPCQLVPPTQFNQAAANQQGVTNNNGVTTGAQTSTVPPNSTGTGACNSSNIEQADPDINSTEAGVLACLASPESTCGTNISGAQSSTGQSSSALGAWQVLAQTNSACYNTPQCEQAANTPGTPLNCAQGYSSGKSLNNSTSQTCLQASANLGCSASAANCLITQQPGCASNPSMPSCYSAWTGTGDGYTHAAQQQCTQPSGG